MSCFDFAGEKIVSNCARFVVIVWVFVVLILIQSYTASLTSLLTVQKMRPRFTDANELIKNKLNVGYYRGSFVHGMLKDMGFQESQLIPYVSAEQCDELFTLGSAKGGIDAAFDSIPTVKVFLATYCSKYTSSVPPTLRSDGYGYVSSLFFSYKLEMHGSIYKSLLEYFLYIKKTLNFVNPVLKVNIFSQFYS